MEKRMIYPVTFTEVLDTDRLIGTKPCLCGQDPQYTRIPDNGCTHRFECDACGRACESVEFFEALSDWNRLNMREIDLLKYAVDIVEKSIAGLTAVHGSKTEEQKG